MITAKHIQKMEDEQLQKLSDYYTEHQEEIRLLRYEIDKEIQKRKNARTWTLDKIIKCLWCGEELKFDPNKGWVHASDGQLYRQRPDGSDDHCATPDRRQQK